MAVPQQERESAAVLSGFGLAVFAGARKSAEKVVQVVPSDPPASSAGGSTGSIGFLDGVPMARAGVDTSPSRIWFVGFRWGSHVSGQGSAGGS